MLVNTEVNLYFINWIELVPARASIWEHYIQNCTKTHNMSYHNQIEVVSIGKMIKTITPTSMENWYIQLF